MCGYERNNQVNKGENNMIVTTLENIEQRVKRNSSGNEKMISNFQKSIERRGLKKGRVRPRSIIEQRILDSFNRK